MIIRLIGTYTTLLCLLYTAPTFAETVQFDLLKATPIGSWQLREDIETNHKGKLSGSKTRTSLLSSEVRNGEKHYWIEMVIESFKISKKGKRKKQGDPAIVKALVSASVLDGDPANVIGNLRGFGAETIIQTGDSDPIRLSNSGGVIQGVMSAAQIEIKHEFETLGTESVSVVAGDFDAKKIHGVGSTDAKILFKKMRIESDSTVWLSPDVPFGTIKIEGSNITNGKTSTLTSELLEFGLSGAESRISKEPTELPSIPGLFGN